MLVNRLLVLTACLAIMELLSAIFLGATIKQYVTRVDYQRALQVNLKSVNFMLRNSTANSSDINSERGDALLMTGSKTPPQVLINWIFIAKACLAAGVLLVIATDQLLWLRLIVVLQFISLSWTGTLAYYYQLGPGTGPIGFLMADGFLVTIQILTFIPLIYLTSKLENDSIKTINI